MTTSINKFDLELGNELVPLKTPCFIYIISSLITILKLYSFFLYGIFIPILQVYVSLIPVISFLDGVVISAEFIAD